MVRKVPNSRLRLSLLSFLIVVMVLGAVVGIAGRMRLKQTVRYITKTREVDGYAVQACWSENRREQTKLVWLVIYPSGGRVVVYGGGDGVQQATQLPSAHFDNAVGVYSSGLYVNLRLVPQSTEQGNRIFSWRSIVSEGLASVKASSEQFSVRVKEHGLSRRCCHGGAVVVDGLAL
jgi:hypothetical protein